MDGVLIHTDSGGGRQRWKIVCWRCEGADARIRLDTDVRAASVTMIQTKQASLGLALLGQTLFGGILVRERLKPAPPLELVALCFERDAELEKTLRNLKGAKHIRVETGIVDGAGVFVSGRERRRKPSEQPKRCPRLVTALQEALRLGPPLDDSFVLTQARESAEAVFETRDGWLVVSSSRATMGLALAGHVLFSRLALARRHPEVRIRSIGVSRWPDDDVAEMLRRYRACDSVQPERMTRKEIRRVFDSLA
jgi:hypothetical protein